MDVRLPSSPSMSFLQDTGATYPALPEFSGKLSPSLGSIVGVDGTLSHPIATRQRDILLRFSSPRFSPLLPLCTAGATEGALALLPSVTTRLTGRHAGPSPAGPWSTALWRACYQSGSPGGGVGGGPGLPPPENCPYYPRPSSLLPFPASALHRTPLPPLPRAPTFLSPFCYPYLGKSSLFHPPSDSVRFATGYKT